MGWRWFQHEAAKCGFVWTRRSIASALEPLVEAGSFDPTDPEWLAAWRWWLQYGVQLADDPSLMAPKLFASQAGYWRSLTRPAGL